MDTNSYPSYLKHRFNRFKRFQIDISVQAYSLDTDETDTYNIGLIGLNYSRVESIKPMLPNLLRVLIKSMGCLS